MKRGWAVEELRILGGGWPLGLLILVAAVLRLGFSLPYYLPGDTLEYLNAPDAYACRELGSPLHITRLGMVGPLALIHWLSGGAHLPLVAYPLLCSLGLVVLSYGLGRHWGGETAGLLAGGLMALVPMEVCYGTVLVPDTPLSFLGLLAFWLLVRTEAEEGQTAQKVALAGACIGLAYTCKEPALFFAGPAAAQAFFLRRRWRDVLVLGAAIAAIIGVEIIVLWALMKEPHLRILETIGFTYGSKGNFAAVERSAGWWLAQIWFKLGAIFWGGHLPTTAMVALVPHLLLISLLCLWRAGRLRVAGWLVAWWGTWWGQQLVLSTIEQEPRYLQAGLPYMAVTIALGFGPLWQQVRPRLRWTLALPMVLSALAGATLFRATYMPRAAATQVLVEHFSALARRGEGGLVSGATDYDRGLAHYAGLQVAFGGNQGEEIAYWVRLSSGYEREQNLASPPTGMELYLSNRFSTPLQSIYHLFGVAPAVGFSSTAEIYHRPVPPLAFGS